MTEEEKQFNQWFDEYANGVKVFEEADMKQAYLQGRAELEKENEELKLKLEALEGQIPWKDIKDKSEVIGQLTNAKEIIREFMKYEINEYDGSLEIHFEELKKQAEQFLSEVEK